MKRIFSIFLAGIMIFSLLSVHAASAEPKALGTVIYVSPDGDDRNDGTEDRPLGSMVGARDRIREIKKTSGLPEDGITVLFRGGEYFWSETVELTEEDSGTKEAPIRYCAYPGEEVCFTGGTRIPGSKFSKVTDESVLTRLRGGKQTRENVRQINIKQFFTDFKQEHHLGETTMLDWYPYTYDVMSVSYTKYEQYSNLYNNFVYDGDEEAAQRYMEQYGPTGKTGIVKRSVYSIGDAPALWSARYPNKEMGEGGVAENPYPVYMKLGKVLQSPWTANPTDNRLTGIAHYSDDRISQYAGYDDVWIDQYSTIFYHDMLRLKNIDPVNKTIETMVRPTTAWTEDAEFCIFNILEELDAPGEMYIDKNTGMMYIYPNVDLDHSFLNVAVFSGDWMLKTDGTSFVEFDGISFENTQGGGIMIDGGDSVSIRYCNLRDIGNNAVALGNSDKVRYWQLPNEWRLKNKEESYNDVIMDYYNYYIDEARSVDVLGKNHSFYGSHIKNTGLSGLSITGGNSWRDEDCNYVIENCDITYVGVYKPTYEAAIDFGNAFGVKILNNKLAHAPGQLINGYLLKGEIAYNYLYDAMSYMRDQGMVYLNYTVMGLDINIHNNWFRQIPEDDHKPPYHTQRFGIYFDDGVTQGLQIKNNIFQNLTSAMQKPVVNSDVTGNIFIECVDLHSKYGAAMTSTNQLFMYPAADGENFWHNQANESMTANLPATWREWSYILALLPVHAEGEVGEYYQKLWWEKYPRIMNYLDIIESGEHKGNFFINIQNNLIVKRERKDWFANNFRFEDMEQYPASGNAIKNNVYVDNNDCFEDYYHENYTLKPSFAGKYGLTSIDQSEIGTLSEFTGTELYKKVVLDLAGILNPKNPKEIEQEISEPTATPGHSGGGSGGRKTQDNDEEMLALLKLVAESAGAELEFDRDAKRITMKRGEKVITFKLGDKEVSVNGKMKKITDLTVQDFAEDHEQKGQDVLVLKIGSPFAVLKGKRVPVDSENAEIAPKIVGDRTLVPLRFIAENIGGDVEFDDESGLITIKLAGENITLTLGEKEIYSNGSLKAVSDVAAQSIGGRTMLPLRVLCEEVFHKFVLWNENGIIVISDETMEMPSLSELEGLFRS